MRIQVRDTELFFDVEGAKLEADGEAMREKPTLILLHGGPGFDHSAFKPTFSCLSDVAQIVYLDHRGNGRSDRGRPEHWTLDEWGDDLHAFCQALGIERPIVLGQSFGGMVAMSYATRHPEHPGKLILSSTTAQTRLDRCYPVFERLGGSEARAAAEAYWSNPGAETLPDYARLCMPLYNQKPADPLANKRVAWNLEVMFAFCGGEDHTMNLLPELAKVQCPTLVLAGVDDPITPLEDSIDICAALSDGIGRLERFEGCGHGVFRDDPERGFEAIRSFVSAA